jgi:hypothetical protein
MFLLPGGQNHGYSLATGRLWIDLFIFLVYFSGEVPGEFAGVSNLTYFSNPNTHCGESVAEMTKQCALANGWTADQAMLEPLCGFEPSQQQGGRWARAAACGCPSDGMSFGCPAGWLAESLC